MRAVGRLAVVAGVSMSVALAGCGGGSSSLHPSGVSPTTLSPTTLAPSAPGPGDNGKTFHVRVGGRVDVSLANGELWSEPTASDPHVLAQTGRSADPSSGNATATFHAAAPGSASIRSTHRCRQQPGKVCAMYIAAWSVTIVVS